MPSNSPAGKRRTRKLHTRAKPEISRRLQKTSRFWPSLRRRFLDEGKVTTQTVACQKLQPPRGRINYRRYLPSATTLLPWTKKKSKRRLRRHYSRRISIETTKSSLGKRKPKTLKRKRRRCLCLMKMTRAILSQVRQTATKTANPGAFIECKRREKVTSEGKEGASATRMKKIVKAATKVTISTSRRTT